MIEQQQQAQSEAVEWRHPREVMLWLAQYLDVYASIVGKEASESLRESAQHLREQANKDRLH